jgi:hypothetical protein
MASNISGGITAPIFKVQNIILFLMPPFSHFTSASVRSVFELISKRRVRNIYVQLIFCFLLGWLAVQIYAAQNFSFFPGQLIYCALPICN